MRDFANTITRVTGIPVRVNEVTEEQFWTPEYRASVFDEMWLQYVPPVVLRSISSALLMRGDDTHGSFYVALAWRPTSKDYSKEISSSQRLLQVHLRRPSKTFLRRTKQYAISWGSRLLDPHQRTDSGGKTRREK